MTEKKIQSGKLLETIVSSIESSLADNPNTKIFRNHKIIDRDGLKREIDVFIEMEVNKRILSIAIECKEFSKGNKVQMLHIDDFYSKISNHGIKGIFVSTGAFSKNAIIKAKNIGIDLFQYLTDKNDFIESLRLILLKHQLLSIKLISGTSSNSYPYPIFVGKTPYSENDFKEYFYKNIVDEYIKKNSLKLKSMFIKHVGDKIEIHANQFRLITIKGGLKNIYVKSNELSLPITSYTAIVSVRLKYDEILEVVAYRYKDVINNRILGSVVTKQVEIDNKATIFTALKLSDENKERYGFDTLDNKDKIQIDYIGRTPECVKIIDHKGSIEITN